MLFKCNGSPYQVRLTSKQPLQRNLNRFAISMCAALSMLLSACHALPSKPEKKPFPVAVERNLSNTNSYTSPADPSVLDDGGGHSSNGNRIDSTTWQTTIHQTFNQARTLVEEELSVDLAGVQLKILSSQIIDKAVAQETQRLVQKQFGHTPFSQAFMKTVMSAQAGTYAALFSAEQQAVLVSESMLTIYQDSLSDNPVLQQQALLTLLIHELVHAADDKRYNIQKNRALNFRASFAQSATFEGHAQWVTRRICAANNCLQGLKALDEFMFSPQGNSRQLTQAVEAISRNVLEYSYVEGERFIEALSHRKDGQQLIRQLLEQPPTDPVQILEPQSYPNVDREQRNQRLLAASRAADHEWAHEQWIGVETSPLKGVNLRDDPERRQAAIDGFTRLIKAMVATQYYNQNLLHSVPVEVILIQAESAPTAKLFASTLHQNSQTFDTQSSVETHPLFADLSATDSVQRQRFDLYRSSLPGKSGESAFQTVVANLGPYVVQINGTPVRQGQFSDFAQQVLYQLQPPHRTGAL